MLTYIATDDEQLRTIAKDVKQIAKIGEMEIKIYRAGDGKPTECTSIKRNDTLNISKIHEKALKGEAKSHATS